MSTIDVYLQALRRYAGSHLTPDAERELRAHLEEAVAAQRAAGLNRGDAEKAAIHQLGRPEIVAAVFRHEGRPWIRRLADGPGGVVSAAQASWRLLVFATAGTALCGLLIAYAWPPMYQARVTLEIAGPRDFGGYLGMTQTLEQLREEEGYHLVLGPPTTVEGLSANRDEAVADARAQAAGVIEAAPAAFRDGLYRDRTLRLQAGEPEVEVMRPIVPAVLAGDLIGLSAAAIAVLLRKQARYRHGRITCDSDQSS